MARPFAKVHRRTLLAAIAVTGLACGNQASPDPAASGSATTSATSLPQVSQGDYCKRVCERAITCGDEAALAVAGKDDAAREAVKKGSPANLAGCIKTCSDDKASDTRLALSDKCAKLTDCKAFAECIDGLARDFRQ
jgi:hypothetical protein